MIFVTVTSGQISSIAYNHLNLPRLITFNDGNTIEYVYNAAGMKLQKKVTENGTLKTTNYVGGMIYEASGDRFLNMEEGRIVLRENGTDKEEYQYQNYKMRNAINLFYLIGLSFILYSCSITKSYKAVNTNENYKIFDCPDNAEGKYDRTALLSTIAEILNNSIPEYSEYHKHKKSFYVDNDGYPMRFFVFDLVDTTNHITSLSDCIDFLDHHIYHFCPLDYKFSFNHFLYLKDKDYVIFYSVNCQDKGNSLQEVISYFDQELENDLSKNDIINRIENYRKYGLYIRMDEQSVIRCKTQ